MVGDNLISVDPSRAGLSSVEASRRLAEYGPNDPAPKNPPVKASAKDATVRVPSEKLDRLVTERFGFQSSFAVTGQTYPRKVDAQVVCSLAGAAASQ